MRRAILGTILALSVAIPTAAFAAGAGGGAGTGAGAGAGTGAGAGAAGAGAGAGGAAGPSGLAMNNVPVCRDFVDPFSGAIWRRCFFEAVQ